MSYCYSSLQSPVLSEMLPNQADHVYGAGPRYNDRDTSKHLSRAQTTRGTLDSKPTETPLYLAFFVENDRYITCAGLRSRTAIIFHLRDWNRAQFDKSALLRNAHA